MPVRFGEKRRRTLCTFGLAFVASIFADSVWDVGTWIMGTFVLALLRFFVRKSWLYAYFSSMSGIRLSDRCKQFLADAVWRLPIDPIKIGRFIAPSVMKRQTIVVLNKEEGGRGKLSPKA